MTVLVTGGAGYIGSNVVLALLEAGERVVVLDNLVTGYRSLLQPGVAFVEGDIQDSNLVKRMVKSEAITEVIHLAGSTNVNESMQKPLKYYQNNTANSLSLFEALLEAGVDKIVFSSTAAVYGNIDAGMVTENCPLSPISPYGSSKLMTEKILADLSQIHGFKHVIMRYFNVAGADPKGRAGQATPEATQLIRVAIQTALGMRSSLQIFGDDWPTFDRTCIRDFIHVSDLAEAHVKSLQYLRKGGKSDTFNCGYGEGYSVKQVIDAVRSVSGTNFEPVFAARRDGDMAMLIADSTKIQKHLNWQPRHNKLESIITDGLNWEKALAN